MIVLQALDFISTFLVINAGGHETTPLLINLSAFLQRIGLGRWAWLILAKSVLIGAIWFGYMRLEQPTAIVSLLGVLVVYYGVVVVGNFGALKVQKALNAAAKNS